MLSVLTAGPTWRDRFVQTARRMSRRVGWPALTAEKISNNKKWIISKRFGMILRIQGVE